jgi:hypothetical protein
MKRELKAGAGATLLVAGALSVALIGGAGSGSAAGIPSSAYGISGTGALPIDPTPFVESTNGDEKTGSAIPVNVPDLLDVGVINVTAANDHATSSVASVGLTLAAASQVTSALQPVLAPIVDGCNQLADALATVTDPLPPALSDLVNQLGGGLGDTLTGTDLVTDTVVLGDVNSVCDNLADTNGSLINIGAVTAECTGHTGSANVAPITLLGLPVSLPEGVNQALSSGALAPVVQPLGTNLKLNTQTTNADGTFTVTAVELDLLDQIHLKIGSVTCGHVTSDGPTAPAPKPTPIKTNVPVTG